MLKTNKISVRDRIRGLIHRWLKTISWGLAGFAFFLQLGFAHAQEPIIIGVSLGLTGQFAGITDMLKNGFLLWERDVNQSGGMLGRRVQLLIHDDRSDPKTARLLYERMIDKDRVDFLFAPYSTKLTEAILPLTENRRFPVLVAGASGDSLWEKGYRYAVGVYTPSNKFIAGFLELLIESDIDKLAVFSADDSFSKDLAASTKIWSRRFGLKIVAFHYFEKGLQDLVPLARQARQEGAAVVIVCGHLEEALNMRAALKRINWYPRAYYASVGAALDTFRDQLGQDANHVFSTSLFEAQARLPGAKRFFDDFSAAYQQPPGYHAGLAYAGGQVLAAAVRIADSLDREKIREALFAMDIMTIIGRYGVDPTGRQIRQQSYITQWQKGQKEIVWPESVKTAAAIFDPNPAQADPSKE
jgi:branched-chain amino acid transport system substrate-binding protein